MADFVNPDTLDLVPSANDMPAPWVVCTRAQLEAWSAIARRYRKWVTDHIEEMSVAEKAAADAAALTASRDAQEAQLANVEGLDRAVLLVILDEFNAHADKINAIMTAIDNASTLAQVKTNIAAIADYPTRTLTQLRNSVRAKLGN